ncbi:5-hydroxytryptamine receptor 1F-like [Dreissena polymorpha]|uniref:5-hydroxytryptamine receptor 1F-like n=1 Tax=Dreissena polymorpha TaxID=45954 RepID=UPI002263B3EF|nr:5-hydroxytryptamine receptor 1F-like [Dreissena polymorpha]
MEFKENDNYYGIIPWTSSTAMLSEGLVDLNDRYARALLPLTITFGFFMVFGVLGNLLIIFIFIKSPDYKRNNFKVFVLTLAVIDLITCITLLPAEMAKHRYYFMFNNALYCKIKCFLNVFGASSSCLALLVISVDRYRKVVHPFKKQLSPKIAVKILIGVAVLFPLCLAIPGALMCGINTTQLINKHGSNTTVYLCETEERYKTSVLRIVYKCIFIGLHCGISFIYLVLYAIIMRVVVKQLKKCAKQQQSKMTPDAYANYTSKNTTMLGHYKKVCDAIVAERITLSGTETVIEVDNKIIRQPHSTSQENESLTHSDTNQDTITSRSKSKRKHTSFKRFSRHSSRFNRNKFPTKTLIWFTLTILFVVTYLLHVVLALTVGKVAKMNIDDFVPFCFFFRMYFANHIVNPMVYALFVKSFRDSSKRVFNKMLGNTVRCL